MKFYLMRHGPAEDQARSGLDADRALSSAGRERVRLVSEALISLEEEPLHIFTSPLVRAVQTAEIVAVVTRLGTRAGRVEVRRELAPGGDGAGLVQTSAHEGLRRVCLVGHEPDLSGAAAALLGTFGRAFEKAMVVSGHISASGERARLRFVLDPKALRLDPDRRDDK
jgi:phosphohistidine phosphatase